jgi:ABC-2 type transport system permease protein
LNRRRIYTVARRQWWSSKRAPFRIFDVALWPVLDILLWGSMGVALSRAGTTTGPSPVALLLSGIMMFNIFFQWQIGITTGFLEESTWTRNLLNVIVSPVSDAEYVLGVALYTLGKALMALCTVTITSFVLFGFGIGRLGWELIPLAFSLTLAGGALGIFVIGVVLRFGQSAEILVWGFNYVVQVVSGVFFPISALPGVFRWLGRITPTSYAFSSLRELVTTGHASTSGMLVALLGSLVALVAACAYSLAMMRQFRRRGYITRFS